MADATGPSSTSGGCHIRDSGVAAVATITSLDLQPCSAKRIRGRRIAIATLIGDHGVQWRRAQHSGGDCKWQS
jgi:hypothetical protein